MSEELFDEEDCARIQHLGRSLISGKSYGKKIIGDMLSSIKDRPSGDPLRGLLNGLAIMMECEIPYCLIVSLWASDNTPIIKQAGRVLKDIGYRS